jgi:hypothetical protein
LAVVLLLPDEVAMKLAGDGLRGQVVVQAEVLFVGCTAPCAQREDR